MRRTAWVRIRPAGSDLAGSQVRAIGELGLLRLCAGNCLRGTPRPHPTAGF